MKKFGILLTLIIISTLLAGTYGVLHDQITYSISSEYFTVFKFDQFGFTEWGNNAPRLTTALIGFFATWWVGLIIGALHALVALIHKPASAMFRIGLRAILITLGTAILFGVIGGFVGYIATGSGEINCCDPYQIIEKRNFSIVGWIHNFGYAGGQIGCVVGLVYQIWKKKNATK